MNKNVMNENVLRITQRIIDRSKATRAAYLDKIAGEKSTTVHRASLSCGNLAHGFAACGKDRVLSGRNQWIVRIRLVNEGVP